MGLTTDENDTMYEIASTDVLRHLMIQLEGYKKEFEREVIAVCKRTDFKATEVTRCSGRVEAVEQIQQALKDIGEKRNG